MTNTIQIFGAKKYSTSLSKRLLLAKVALIGLLLMTACAKDVHGGLPRDQIQKMTLKQKIVKASSFLGEIEPSWVSCRAVPPMQEILKNPDCCHTSTKLRVNAAQTNYEPDPNGEIVEISLTCLDPAGQHASIAIDLETGERF